MRQTIGQVQSIGQVLLLLLLPGFAVCLPAVTATAGSE